MSKNILIIRFSSLGDLVTLEPTFRAFRHFFNDAKITFLTSPIGKGLYEERDYFDDFVVHKDFIDTVKAIRKNHYDLIINLQCNRPSHWMTLLVSKSQIINQSATMFQKYFHIKPKPKTTKQVLLEAGVDANKLEEYFSSPTVIALPHNKSKYNWNTSGKKIVALASGTSERWKSKKWGDERYAQLAKLLIDYGFEVILVGSELEKEAGDTIEKQIPQVVNMIAKTSLSELKSVLASVDLLVGNDSGPAHIAAGVGTNTVSIFGSTDVKHCVKYETKGYSGEHLCIAPVNIDCHPCYKSVCPTKHECMDSIKVETVFEHVKNLLEKTHD